MATELARSNNGTLAHPDDIGGSYQPMRPLDVYSKGLSEEAPRVDAIATISCGRLEEGKPRAARKNDPQWIHIHDENNRAEGLTKALMNGEGRRLTIAFQFDDPSQFIQQRFTEYTSSALKVYGDEKRITEIIVHGQGNQATAEHRTFDAGTNDYDRLVARCKVNVSVYFALAEWSKEGPRVTFPDGLGLYRLRFTSRNSLRNLLATLDYVAKFTRGRIAGIPFNLGVDFREVARSTGIKTTIPVFTFTMAPPGGITSLTFRDLTGKALAQGEALHMLPPTTETWETATLDGPVNDDITDEQADLMARGGRCDKQHYVKTWHATVRGTSLQPAEARAAFISEHTGDIGSLTLFLDGASESEASALIEAAWDYLTQRGEIEMPDDDEPAKATADDYDRTYGQAYQDEPDQKPAAPVIDAEARDVTNPDEPPDDDERTLAMADEYAESDETARRAVGELDEVLGSQPASDPDGEPVVWDYGMCLELYEAHADLNLPKVFANGKADYYAGWHAKFMKALEASRKEVPA